MSIALALACAVVAQKTSVPKQQDKTALASPHVKELVLLMDADKNGKISKQEWMKFMEAEFDRLDKDNSGELSTQELLQSRVSVSQQPFSTAGK
jgi:Ca2+-binding EF-hand superfamily protein